MIIGELYLVKSYHWVLFPAKEQAVAEALVSSAMDFERAGSSLPQIYAKWLSERCKCNVSFFEPNTYVVLLKADEDERFYKLLDSNGNIGWIVCFDFSKNFELVKAKQ